MTPDGCHHSELMGAMPSGPPASARPELRALWPLVTPFGIFDDVGRDQALRAASDEDLMQLVAAVGSPEFEAINAYLNSTHDAEEAVPYGELAEAAMEAAVYLASRE